MKNLVIFGLFTLLSMASAEAAPANCLAEAKIVAKMNLDQFAKQYGYESSEIAGAALVRTMKVKITKTFSEKLSVIKVDGSIYRATYTVTVVMDDACAVHSVNIHDDASL